MGRKRKLSASDSDTLPEDDQIEEEVEEQTETSGSVIDKARSVLSGSVANVQEKLGPKPLSRGGKWHRENKAKSKEQEASVATLITSLFVMLIAGWQVPADLKPSEDEISAVSGFSTSILLRHVNLSGRLTQDVMDVIGIVAVIASYTTRTSATWRLYREAKAAQITAGQQVDKPTEAENVRPEPESIYPG